jgi:AcrR family transcriptional regulator
MTDVLRDVRAVRRDARDNRQKLLRAAESVFGEHGLGAGVEDIARTAGVGIGTLYRHFPTKDALLSELATKLVGEVIEVARDCLGAPAGSGLELFMRRVGELQCANRGSHLTLWFRHANSAQVGAARAVMKELLADAQQQGAVRDEVTFEDISMLLIALGLLIEESASVAPAAWRRFLELEIAALGREPRPLRTRSVTRAEMDKIRNAQAARR